MSGLHTCSFCKPWRVIWLMMTRTSAIGCGWARIINQVRMMAFRVKSVLDILHSNPSCPGHTNNLSIKVLTYYVACYITCYIPCFILAGRVQWLMQRDSDLRNSHGHHTGKESLDINLLNVEAERHSEIPLADHGLLQCENDAAPEWVTYQCRTEPPILRWLPSNLLSRLLTTWGLSYRFLLTSASLPGRQ